VTVLPFSFTYADLISFALVIAAVSKSAQVGLHIWLPDAMEGPTPVSAMIHAATMVTAGLYLLLKCSPLLVLSPGTMNFVILLGATTVLITSVLGSFQYDIKKIIAFSTCSQLGYMMTIIGSSYFSLAFFHLLTHAFFKALLFLAAGSIIHLMQGEQDVRRLAGAFTRRRKSSAGFSFLQVAFLLGTLSITGLFFFSGYYSKELILYALAFSCSTGAGFFS
jgi:NADH:ubiquinone oxidoreductase subunit 5 (subunit L)/multisubunit Na+/H+ antiporter MnhA subunit